MSVFMTTVLMFLSYKYKAKNIKDIKKRAALLRKRAGIKQIVTSILTAVILQRTNKARLAYSEKINSVRSPITRAW